MNKLVAVIMIVADILLFNAVIAQNDASRYSIQHFNNENGLPQNGIFNIEWDTEGFCWLATQSGLVRFDGRNFRTFTKNEVPGLQTNFFTTFAKDAAGNLFSKDDYGNRIKIVTGNRQASYPLVVKDSFLTGEKGYLYRGKNYPALLSDYLTNPLIKIAINRKHYFGVNDSCIYFFTKEKGWYFEGNNATEFSIAKPVSYQDGITSDMTMLGNFFVIIHAQNNIECFKDGIKQNVAKKIEGDITNDKNFAQGKFRLLWCSRGSFIIAGNHLYAIYLVNRTLTSKLIFSNLSINAATGAYYNASTDTYFITTYDDGFYAIKKQRFISLQVPGDKAFSNIYFGQQALLGGAVFANNKKFFPNGEYKDYWLCNQRPSLLCNQKNTLLWYSYLDSLFAFSLADKERVFAYHLDNPVSSYCISAFNDSLFFSSGFSVFSILNNEPQWIIKNDSLLLQSLSSTPDNEITAFGVLRNGNFLLGTHNGLYMHDALHHKTRLVAGGLQIVKIQCEKDGWNWIATNGNGFYAYKDETLIPLLVSVNKPVSIVYEFTKDNRDNFWLATDDGLIKIGKQILLRYIKDKSRFLFAELYDKSNGYTTNEFNGGVTPSAVVLPDGRHSFSTSKELVWFYPDSLPSSFTPSSIYIDECVADGKKLPVSSDINIQPGFTSLSVAVSYPQFSHANANAVMYALNNDTAHWQKLPDNNTLVFNKLPHGDYSVRLRRGDSNGNYITVEQRFVVLPFFYETWWFKTITILLLAMGVYLFINMRLRLLKQQKLRLEETVSHRTVELQSNIHLLQNTIRELEQSEEKIYQASRFKEKMISIILHDLRSPLRFISSISSELLISHENITPAQLKEELNALSNESGSIYNFTNELLTWVYAQQSDYAVQKKSLLLDEVLQQVYDMYKLIAAQRNNRLLLHTNELIITTDENMLKIIIRNLVDNAVKYTSEGTIEIKAEQQGNVLQIIIADTGIGMDNNRMEMLNNNLVNVNNSGDKKLGLVLSTELIKKLDGSLHCSANKPSGTIMQISFPVSE